MKKFTYNVDSDIRNQINLMAEDGVNQAFIAQQLSIPRATVSRCIQEVGSKVDMDSSKSSAGSKTIFGSRTKKNIGPAKRENPMVLLNLPLSEIQEMKENQKKPATIDFSLPQDILNMGKTTKPQKSHISDYDSKLCRLFGIEKEIKILLENLSEATIRELKDSDVDGISVGKRKNAFKVTDRKNKRVKTCHEKEECFVKNEKQSGLKSLRMSKNSPSHNSEVEDLFLTTGKKPVINIVDLATDDNFKKIISNSKNAIKNRTTDVEKSQNELPEEAVDTKREISPVSECSSLSNLEFKKEIPSTLASGDEKHLLCQNSLNVIIDEQKLSSFRNSNGPSSLIHEKLHESDISPRAVTEKDSKSSCLKNNLQSLKIDAFKSSEKKDDHGIVKELTKETSLTDFEYLKMENGCESQNRKFNSDASVKEVNLESSETMDSEECLKLEEIFEKSFEDVCVTGKPAPKPTRKQGRRSSRKRKIRKRVSDAESDCEQKQSKTKKLNDIEDPVVSEDASHLKSHYAHRLKSDPKNLKGKKKISYQSTTKPNVLRPKEQPVRTYLNQTRVSPRSNCKKRVLRDENDTQSSKTVRFKGETLSVKVVDSPNYALIDTEKIRLGFRELLCPKCHKNVGVKFPCISERLDTEVEISCMFCNTIKQYKKTKRCLAQLDENPVNFNSLYLRLVCSSLDFGGGYKQLESTCAALEIPYLPLKTFQKYCKFILKQTKAKVDKIIHNAGQSVHKAYNEAGQASDHKGIRNISVFYDGSWIPKGRYSNYGLVVVFDLNTGLILDYHLMSRFCGKCVVAQKKKIKNGTMKHVELGLCEVNFKANPKEMESEGKNVLYHRSASKHQLIYNDPNVEKDNKNQVTDKIPVKENALKEIPDGEPIQSNKIQQVIKNVQIQKNESPEILKNEAAQANKIPEISEDKTMETDKTLETSKDEEVETNKLSEISKEASQTNSALGIFNDETVLVNETCEISKDKGNSSLNSETVLPPPVLTRETFNNNNNLIQENAIPSLNSKNEQILGSSPVKTMTLNDDTLEKHSNSLAPSSVASATESGKLYSFLINPKVTQGLHSGNCQDINESERSNAMKGDVNEQKIVFSKNESNDTVKSTVEARSENEPLDLDEIMSGETLLCNDQLENGDQDDFMKRENIFDIMETDSNKFKPIISSFTGGVDDNLGNVAALEKEPIIDELEFEPPSPSKISHDDGGKNSEQKNKTASKEEGSMGAICHSTNGNENEQLKSTSEGSNLEFEANKETKNLNTETSDEVNGKNIFSSIEIFHSADENKKLSQVDGRETQNVDENKKPSQVDGHGTQNLENKHELLSSPSKEQSETTKHDLGNPMKSLVDVSSGQAGQVEHSKENLSQVEKCGEENLEDVDLCRNQVEEETVTNSEKHSTYNPSVALQPMDKPKDCSQQSSNDNINEIKDVAVQPISTDFLISDVSPEMNKKKTEKIIDITPKTEKLVLDELTSQSANQLKNDSESQSNDPTESQTCKDECHKSIKVESGKSQHGNEEEKYAVKDSLPVKTQFAEVLKRIKVETLRSAVFKKCNRVKYFHRDNIEFACIYAIICHNTNIRSYWNIENNK